VRHADGRHVEDSAEVEGQATSAGVIAARSVNQEDVGKPRQCPHRRLEQLAFAQAEKTCLIRSSRNALHDNLCLEA
jgi:hypothetical protein